MSLEGHEAYLAASHELGVRNAEIKGALLEAVIYGWLKKALTDPKRDLTPFLKANGIDLTEAGLVFASLLGKAVGRLQEELGMQKMKEMEDRSKSATRS